MSHQAARGARRRLMASAAGGALASAALLAAWFFASAGGRASGKEPAALLLEFFLDFVVALGVLVFALALLGARSQFARRATEHRRAGRW
jgi:hypothetical protein